MFLQILFPSCRIFIFFTSICAVLEGKNLLLVREPARNPRSSNFQLFTTWKILLPFALINLVNAKTGIEMREVPAMHQPSPIAQAG